MSRGARELFGRRLLNIEYDHVDDPRDVSRVHDFGAGARMYARPDGSVLLKSATPGQRLWDEFPGGRKGKRLFLVNPEQGVKTMARRMPPRYKSGPNKGQFMPKSARRSKRRRRNPPAAQTQATNPPRRRRRKSSSSPTRHRRRRNPPRMSLSPKSIGKELVQGVKDAGCILLGKAVARGVPQHLKLPQAGAVGLLVQTGVALAAGFAAHKGLGRDAGRFVLAGGLAAPMETFIVAKNIPLLAPALSPGTAGIALGAYANADMPRLAPPRALASYARASGLQAYASAPGYGDGDY